MHEDSGDFARSTLRELAAAQSSLCRLAGVSVAKSALMLNIWHLCAAEINNICGKKQNKAYL